MAGARALRDEPADGVLRAGGAAGRRGDDHAGSLPVARVVLYGAEGCGLCAVALEVLREVRSELGFELDVVGIDGDAALEARYREQIPVVEIDGERAFVHFVDADALRKRLAG